MAKTAELWLAAKELILAYESMGDENFVYGVGEAYQRVQRKKNFIDKLERLEEFVAQPIEYEHERELDKHYKMGREAASKELQQYCRVCDTGEYFICYECNEEIHRPLHCPTRNHHPFIHSPSIKVF